MLHEVAIIGIKAYPGDNKSFPAEKNASSGIQSGTSWIYMYV